MQGTEPAPLGAHPHLDRPWREWYQLGVWRRRRRLQLIHHPLCVLCLQRGVVTIATVADHIEPHRGDWNAFLLGELQSLCAKCHSGPKRNVERHGHTDEIDADGWPTDPMHPANRAGQGKSPSS
jgi:hypothetical protein